MTEFRVSARLALTLRKDADRFGLTIEQLLWLMREAAGLTLAELVELAPPVASRKAQPLRLVDKEPA